MPAKYEAIRNKFIANGMPSSEAKTHAAKIFNAQRGSKTAPVTGKERTVPYSKRK